MNQQNYTDCLENTLDLINLTIMSIHQKTDSKGSMPKILCTILYAVRDGIAYIADMIEAAQMPF